MPKTQPVLKPYRLTAGAFACPSCGEKIHGFESACPECGQAPPANRWTPVLDIDDAGVPVGTYGRAVHYDARIYRKGDRFRVLITQPSTEKGNAVIRNAGRIAAGILWEFFRDEEGDTLSRTEWFLYDERGTRPPRGIAFTPGKNKRLHGKILQAHPGFFAETDPEGGIPGDAPRWNDGQGPDGPAGTRRTGL